MHGGHISRSSGVCSPNPSFGGRTPADWLDNVLQDDFNPLDEIDSEEERWQGNASDDGSDFLDYGVLHSPLRSAAIRSGSSS